MKSEFSAFYKPSAADFRRLWNEGIFVLDANVLLNIHRYPKAARDDLLSALSQAKTRLWIPFQAALEYHRNRPAVISEQKSMFRNTTEVIEHIMNKLEDDFNKLQLRRRHASIDPDRLIGKIKPAVDAYLDELRNLEEIQVGVNDVDPLSDSLAELLGGKIGEAPTQDWLDGLYREGEKRYAENMPPGFRDEDKGKKTAGAYRFAGLTVQAKYGDLIIWKQTLDYASSAKPSGIVFLTDDEKEDWWWIVEAQGKKRLGPRPELVEEMARVGGVRNFYIYNSAQFLEQAKTYLKAQVSAQSISDVQETAEAVAEAGASVAHQAFAAEYAVYEWLTHQYPPENVFRNRRFPDFVVADPESLEHVGYEVKLLTRRSLRSLRQLTEDVFLMGRVRISAKSLNRLVVVLASFDGEVLNAATTHFANVKSDLFPGSGILIGRLFDGMESGTTVFQPIHQFP